jgi:hypothetical protein
MFHYVHSQFLIGFFPIDTGTGPSSNADMATYAEVARRYWPFLPSAFLAHRYAFRRHSLAFTFGGITVGKNDVSAGRMFSEPYRNVARMHMLIFFFFIAHLAKLENFIVYAVVYAVYFFPWRLIRRQSVQPALEKSKPATRAELLKSFLTS